MDFGVTWIDRERTLVALRGFGGATQSVECVSQGHECIGKIRPDADGCLVVGHSTRELTGARQEVAQVEVGSGIPPGSQAIARS
jgi:hypothetical protein